MPKISEMASPPKIRSVTMMAEPKLIANMVSRIGRRHTAPASRPASPSGMPCRMLSWMKSMISSGMMLRSMTPWYPACVLGLSGQAVN